MNFMKKCKKIVKKQNSSARLDSIFYKYKNSDSILLVTLLQWKVWNFFPEISAKIFSWKSAYKNVPNAQHRSTWLHPCSAQNSVYQASHCSALLIRWLNFCCRVYILDYGKILGYLDGMIVRRQKSRNVNPFFSIISAVWTIS